MRASCARGALERLCIMMIFTGNFITGLVKKAVVSKRPFVKAIYPSHTLCNEVNKTQLPCLERKQLVFMGFSGYLNRIDI